LLVSSFLFFACEEKKAPPAKTVASVDDVRLSGRELDRIMKLHSLDEKNRSKAVNSWIESEIYYAEAKRRGLLDAEKYKILSEENRRQIAKALLIDEFFETHPVIVSETDAREYYERHKSEFVLHENACLVNTAFFQTLDVALDFRKFAIKKNWTTAVRKFSGRYSENDFLLEKDFPTAEAMRAAKFLSEGEISPVFKTSDGSYFVFSLKRRTEAGEILPFDAVRTKVETRFALEKKAKMFSEYKKQIFKNHTIEIYGDLNE
jgi:hypothetical protein